VEFRLGQCLIDTGLVSAERATTLQQESNALERRTIRRFGGRFVRLFKHLIQ
jgi:hypothetical protein